MASLNDTLFKMNPGAEGQLIGELSKAQSGLTSGLKGIEESTTQKTFDKNKSLLSEDQAKVKTGITGLKDAEIARLCRSSSGQECSAASAACKQWHKREV